MTHCIQISEYNNRSFHFRQGMATMNIFLNYRRDDTAGHTGRLYDYLCRFFGKDRIFVDFDLNKVRPGDNFVSVCKIAASTCKIFIPVIGRNWLSTTNLQSRLDDPHDLVRQEIAIALGRRSCSVIPVLVQGASMPSDKDLPDELDNLAYLNALEISDLRFHYDARKLIKRINEVCEVQSISEETLIRL